MSVNLCAKNMSKKIQNQKFSCSWVFLPVFLGISSLVGMIVTYTMAKNNCHVQQWKLPYISYTGTEMPESTVFGLILNLEGFLGFVVVIIAWRFQRHIGENSVLGQATLVCGLISCLGVIMVGNFPVSKLNVPHYIGAGLAFFVGTAYCGLASVLCYKVMHKIRNLRGSTIICILRILATVIMLISLVVGLFTQITKKKFKEDYGKSKLKSELGSRTEWQFPNGSCKQILDKVPVELQALDLAGSLTEWLLTSCLLFFLTLYAYEFKMFQSVKIILRSDTGSLLNIDRWSERCGKSPSPKLDSRRDSSTEVGLSLISKSCECNCHKSSLNYEYENHNPDIIFKETSTPETDDAKLISKQANNNISQFS